MSSGIYPPNITAYACPPVDDWAPTAPSIPGKDALDSISAYKQMQEAPKLDAATMVRELGAVADEFPDVDRGLLMRLWLAATENDFVAMAQALHEEA